MTEVLGPEYGPLAGRTPEEALKITLKYASKLEDEADAGAVDLDVDDTPPEKKSALDFVKDLKTIQTQPMTTESFVGKREAAKATARHEIIEVNGEDWDSFSPYIETVMSNATAEQQQSAPVWKEAFWLVWGQAERVRRIAETPPDPVDDTDQDPDAHPRTEPRREESVQASPANAARGNPRARVEDTSRNKIEDPIERNTKSKFARVLGVEMSDAEWLALQNEEINTLEDYQALQKRLSKGS